MLFVWAAERIAANIDDTDGDANIPPQIAPDNIPYEPIHPAWDGSCPEPPPLNNCTAVDDFGVDVNTT